MQKNRAAEFVRVSFAQAKESFVGGDSSIAWQLLAEAHIASQPYAWLHFIVHYRMFILGIKQKNWKEVWGQTLRLLLAIPGSVSKRYPVGNPGLSNVSMFQPMHIPESLLEKMVKFESKP